jgi:hypothetical protein
MTEEFPESEFGPTINLKNKRYFVIESWEGIKLPVTLDGIVWGSEYRITLQVSVRERYDIQEQAKHARTDSQ